MVAEPGERVVVKVGGSLFDLPDLGSRLRDWLAVDKRVQPPAAVLLVPGGGPTTDVIRGFDKRFGLGEETAHWLALRTLTLNAHVLAALLPGAPVVAEVSRLASGINILDAFPFLQRDEPASLPAHWDAASDAVAARAAVVLRARRLVLLKSVNIPAAMDWEEAGRQGLIDPMFASILRQAEGELEVSAVNLREWRP